MKAAIKRFRFTWYILGLPLGKCIKCALFGKGFIK